MMMKRNIAVLSTVFSVFVEISPIHSFALSPTRTHYGVSTRLSGIAEWRDLDYGILDQPRPLGGEQGPLPKSICILPFPFQDVLLQGETKQLRLYEDRFIKLFEDCMENHEGVVAMGLLADSGIVSVVPLCEIESYNRMEEFGIFVTIRAVGRAKLTEINQQEPYLKAVCTELSDKLPPNMELPNLLASSIEQLILWLSNTEDRLQRAEKENGTADPDSDLKRRIALAKLDDRFYAEDDADDDDGDEGDDNNDESVRERTRQDRYRIASKVARETDTQGYQIISQVTGERSPQELTAISWAAFCTEPFAEQDITFRLRALDYDNLFDRLKLALYMLRAKQVKLKSQLEKAGLKCPDSDEETESDASSGTA